MVPLKEHKHLLILEFPLMHCGTVERFLVWRFQTPLACLVWLSEPTLLQVNLVNLMLILIEKVILVGVLAFLGQLHSWICLVFKKRSKVACIFYLQAYRSSLEAPTSVCKMALLPISTKFRGPAPPAPKGMAFLKRFMGDQLNQRVGWASK